MFKACAIILLLLSLVRGVARAEAASCVLATFGAALPPSAPAFMTADLQKGDQVFLMEEEHGGYAGQFGVVQGKSTDGLYSIELRVWSSPSPNGIASGRVVGQRTGLREQLAIVAREGKPLIHGGKNFSAALFASADPQRLKTAGVLPNGDVLVLSAGDLGDGYAFFPEENVLKWQDVPSR